jgi:hypothetical protein
MSIDRAEIITWILLMSAVLTVFVLVNLGRATRYHAVIYDARRLASLGLPHMKLTNNSYTISIGTKNFSGRYYCDEAGWLKVRAVERCG